MKSIYPYGNKLYPVLHILNVALMAFIVLHQPQKMFAQVKLTPADVRRLKAYEDQAGQTCRLLYDVKIQPRLKLLLGPEFIHLRNNIYGVDDGCWTDDGWLFMSGQAAHEGGEEHGFVGVSLDTGSVYAALFTKQKFTIYGIAQAYNGDSNTLPLQLTDWINRTWHLAIEFNNGLPSNTKKLDVKTPPKVELSSPQGNSVIAKNSSTTTASTIADAALAKGGLPFVGTRTFCSEDDEGQATITIRKDGFTTVKSDMVAIDDFGPFPFVFSGKLSAKGIVRRESGRYLEIVSVSAIRMHDGGTWIDGKPCDDFFSEESSVNSVVFSPDGATLASGNFNSTIKLWDVASGKHLKTLIGHSRMISSLAFSPNGTMLASGGNDGTIRLWDLATGKELSTLQGNIFSVAFSPDGKTLASGDNITSKLWDVASGRASKILKGHTGVVRSVAFSPDGKTLASGGWDGIINLWDVASWQAVRTFKWNAVVKPVNSSIVSIDFSPDGKTLAGGSVDIKLWDVASGRELKTLKRQSENWSSIAFCAGGKILASGGDDNGPIKMWDVASGRELKTLTGHTSIVNSVACSPDGWTLASGSDDKTIRLWDLVSGQQLKILGLPKVADNVNGSSNSVSVKEQSVTADSGRDSITSIGKEEMGVARAMFMLYGNYDSSTNSASWRGKETVYIDGYAELVVLAATPILSKPFMENNTPKFILVTSSFNKEEPADCHACGVRIGAAVFVKKDNIWRMELGQKDVALYGAFGAAPDADMVKIGPDRFAFTFSWGEMHGGDEGYIVNYIDRVNGKFKEILTVVTSHDTSGAGTLSPAEANETSKSKIEYVQGSNPAYFDIKVTSRGKRGAKVGRRVIMRPFTEVKVYKFSGRCYKTPGEPSVCDNIEADYDIPLETTSSEIPKDPTTEAQVDPNSLELRYWEMIKNSTNSELFKIYLSRYPNGRFAEEARLRVESAKPGANPAKPAATPLPAEMTAAERARNTRVFEVQDGSKTSGWLTVTPGLLSFEPKKAQAGKNLTIQCSDIKHFEPGQSTVKTPHVNLFLTSGNATPIVFYTSSGGTGVIGIFVKGLPEKPVVDITSNVLYAITEACKLNPTNH